MQFPNWLREKFNACEKEDIIYMRSRSYTAIDVAVALERAKGQLDCPKDRENITVEEQTR